MKLLLTFLLLCIIAEVVLSQQPARIGPDGKPLLNRPIVEECKKRKSHLKWGSHHYFLSWREPWHKFEDWDWFNGRNFCRDRCMDLVSFDTPGEYEIFAAIALQDNINSTYTSGRKCNFKGKGCDAAHLQPINKNGWFWAGASNTRIPDTETNSEFTYWSPVGETGQRQPDNYEGLKEGPIDTDFDIGVTIEGLQEYHDEACLAAMNNKYQDGFAWHDVACHFRSVIICEDSDQLISLVKSQDGEDVTETVVEGKNAVDIDTLDLASIQPIVRNPLQQAPPLSNRPANFPQPQRRPRPPLRPKRRPTGFLGALGFRGLPFLFK